MTGGAGVEDGPFLYGIGIGADCFQQDRSCKGIVVGGDQMRVRKINIGVYFIAVVRP